MATIKSKEKKVKKLETLLLRYLDNPEHRNARKLLARKAVLTKQSFSNQKNIKPKTLIE